LAQPDNSAQAGQGTAKVPIFQAKAAWTMWSGLQQARSTHRQNTWRSAQV